MTKIEEYNEENHLGFSALCSCQLGMEDEDVIEVYQEQTGGLWND